MDKVFVKAGSSFVETIVQLERGLLTAAGLSFF